VALIGAARGVEHDDAPIAIAVCNVQLVGDRIQHHVRRPSELRAAVASLGLPLAPDLQDEFAGRRELEDLVVLRPLPAIQTLPAGST
jgi:hypothetical protein